MFVEDLLWQILLEIGFWGFGSLIVWRIVEQLFLNDPF